MRQHRGADKNTPFATIEQTAERTGLSKYFLRSGCRSGTVPHIKSGTTFYINVPALLEKLNAEAHGVGVNDGSI